MKRYVCPIHPSELAFTSDEAEQVPTCMLCGEGMVQVEKAEEKGERELRDFEDRFEHCDNCNRLTLTDDLKVMWCRDTESGEQVDARICGMCRLGAEDKRVRDRLDSLADSPEWVADLRAGGERRRKAIDSLMGDSA